VVAAALAAPSLRRATAAEGLLLRCSLL